MNSNLIPSMKDTLFNPIQTNMSSTLLEVAEVGLDSVLQDGLLKDIPVLGSIAALCKTGVNLRERNLIRQTASFITSFNDGTINEEKLHTYKYTLEKDPKKAEKELGRVIILLDRMLEEQQAKVLGFFYNACVKGALSWDKFVEVSEVNARMFTMDYSELYTIFKLPVTQDEEVNARRLCQIQRLVSLGLVMENRSRLFGGNRLSYPDTDERFVTTPLGSTFAGLIKKLFVSENSTARNDE